MKMGGRFIVVDGLTGSGKSTVLQAVTHWAVDCGQRIFLLQDWKESAPPRFEDIPDYEVYFTYEPTRHWVGAAIRYELSRTDQPYGGEELAHAFALDRELQYRRLILPALKAGKTIIQDRGVSSSIVYQPVMPNSLPVESLLKIPGNKLALQHAPTALVLTRVPADMAASRIQSRSEENKGVFADIEFLKKQEERFASPWFRELFESRGTKVFELDTSGSLEYTQTLATKLINHILTTC
jgi:thymidylate kinase